MKSKPAKRPRPSSRAWRRQSRREPGLTNGRITNTCGICRAPRFETLNTQLLSELPGYVGGSVADRPEEVEPELTLREFDEHLRNYVISGYHHAVHGTTGQRPIERWSLLGMPRMPESLRQLDLLLVYVCKGRVVHRNGVRLMNQVYWADELAELIGEEVQVRYDPRDLGKI